MGQPCPIVSSCHGTVGVTGACLPAGYSVAVGEFDGNPKTKGKAGGGGGRQEWVLGTPGLQGALPSQGFWVVPTQESCPSLCPHAHPSAVVGALRALVPRRVRGGGPQQKQHEGRGEWCPAAWGCLVVGTPLWPGTLGWHPRMGTGTGPDAALGRWRSSVWG